MSSARDRKKDDPIRCLLLLLLAVEEDVAEETLPLPMLPLLLCRLPPDNRPLLPVEIDDDLLLLTKFSIGIMVSGLWRDENISRCGMDVSVVPSLRFCDDKLESGFVVYTG